MATLTPNMVLKVFNLQSDLYDYVAVANNLAIIDQHDHSQGKGLQIGTAGLQNGSITASKLAAGAVTASKLAAGAVTLGSLDVTLSALVPTAWVALTLSTGIAATGGYTPSARLEGGTIVRLKGQMQNVSGAGFPANAPWATVPVGLRPTASLTFPTAIATAGVLLQLGAIGAISLNSTLNNNALLPLDGITFTVS